MINKETKYYYINNGKKGPFTIDELLKESVTSNTLIWFEDLDDWKKLNQIPELYDYIKLNKKNNIVDNATNLPNNEEAVRNEHYTKPNKSKNNSLVLIGIFLTLLVFGWYYYKHPKLLSSIGFDLSSMMPSILESNSEKIIGEWKVVSFEAPANGDNANNKDMQGAMNLLSIMQLSHDTRYIFSENGAMEKIDDSERTSFEYKIKNDTIFLVILGNNFPFEKIIELNNNQLKMKEIDGFQSIAVLKRIN